MLDIFDILGPVMVGPSSSHTAGAVRIGRMARTLLGAEVARADIGLHGSFADTGRGHGTDRALVAGLLGMKPDDLGIPQSLNRDRRGGAALTVVETDQKIPADALERIQALYGVLGATYYEKEED